MCTGMNCILAIILKKQKQIRDVLQLLKDENFDSPSHQKKYGAFKVKPKLEVTCTHTYK